ncbi:MAG: hypothetical protein HETSPECPRED_010242 [Heterodermia speciosa]|uniref:Uncharacterized protein n=1 Tax=Heterodermia speciosa TaxID=116794 RepID=A0A8H3ET68_9LECA|nr:MAG: hypothetical protein HETSPECPRED_010242 [Heterodermia speciosa]
MALSNGPSLLTLPPEIRNLIYGELLCIPNATPLSPFNSGPRFHERCSSGGNLMLSGERFPTHSHTNLLLCNHQLYNEFLAFLGTLNGAWEYAKLDCMAISGNLLPTWVIFPAGHTPSIGTLDIDLRVWWINSVDASCIWVTLSSCLDNLLCGLLKFGPTLRSNGHHVSMMSVDLVSIRILLQTHIIEEELGDFDEDSQPDDKIGTEIGIEIEKFLEMKAPWILARHSVKMLRLKLKLGAKLWDSVIVARSRGSAIGNSGV